MKTQEKLRVEKEYLDALRDTAERTFDFLVKEGWLAITDKKPIKISGCEIVNYKNGAEFGKIFARIIEMKTENLWREIKPGKEELIHS